jgi:hypothetical protein
MTSATVPNFPGRHYVEMMLIDFDVLQANRERGGGIFKSKNEYVFQGKTSMLKAPGYTTATVMNNGEIGEWARVIDLMKFIDLYPDLNLPTYRELQEYLSTLPESRRKEIYSLNPYLVQKNAIYVDPDFYFVSPTTFNSKVLNSVKKGEKVTLKDMLNQTLDIPIGETLEKTADKLPKDTGARNTSPKVPDSNTKELAQQEVVKKKNFNSVVKLTSKQVQIVQAIRKTIPEASKKLLSKADALIPSQYRGNKGNAKWARQLPEELVLGLAYSESNFNQNPPGQKAGAACVGVMQVNTYYHAEDGNSGHQDYNYDNVTTKQAKENYKKNIKLGIGVLINCFKGILKDSSSRLRRWTLVYDHLKPDTKTLVATFGEGGPYFFAAAMEYKGITPPKLNREKAIDQKAMTNFLNTRWKGLGGKTIDELADIMLTGVSIVYSNKDKLNVDGQNDFLTDMVVANLAADVEQGTVAGIELKNEKPNAQRIPSVEGAWADTVKFSARGRMLRAFPTFYLFLIDEGRSIRWAKMWDNFYGFSSIQEISVNRSRKRAADTAVISLTNLYNIIQDGQDNTQKTPEFKFNIKDFFLPTITKQMEEYKSYTLGGLVLMPGCRIHLRLGYGNYMNNIPILFNGTITELAIGESVQIIAQSDALELTDKLNFREDDTQDHFGLGIEPENLLKRLLLYGDGNILLKEAGNVVGLERLFGDKSKDKVVHFGDPKFNYI